MFSSRFMPCPRCGESLQRADLGTHQCPEVEGQVLKEVTEFETRLRDYLSTSAGRFEVWLAARKVRETAG